MSTYLWAHNRHTFSIASLSFFKTRYGSLIEDNTLSMAAILIGELSELWWLATGGNSNTSRCRHSASFGSTMSKALQRQENEDCIKHRIFIFTLRKKVQIVRRHWKGNVISFQMHLSPYHSMVGVNKSYSHHLHCVLDT